MAKYIERDVVDKVIDTARKMYLNDFGAVEVVQQIKSKLCNIPNADVKPVKRGIWIDVPTDTYSNWYKCSNCKYTDTKKFNFCPICGVDLRGENDA